MGNRTLIVKAKKIVFISEVTAALAFIHFRMASLHFKNS